MHPLLTQSDIDAFRRDGVVLIHGLFRDHVDTLRAGIARNMAEPGPTSPPFPGHGMQEGDHLREDWFPVIWERGAA